ncbi:complement c3 [Limosa lapponica baueri]|uniref:Complement c3 n=1 Tax=Limosa lapponica baueri TaxID=1758121 RepID=A0A2I0T8K5_LIMLA|nr:complement c3 [Limosa lapponica baueri]
MPFDLMVYVTNPDKSPAPRVPVKADGFQGLVTTQRDGTAKLVLNMPANKDSVPITVRTDQPELPPDRQASRHMVAEAYRSQSDSGNLLHLAVGATELQPGDNLPVNFHLKSNNNAVRNSVPYFTYLIMSKGRIVHVGRQRHEAGQSLVTMSLPVTAQLIPSFRIVAYYYVLPGEIVADSVWVDVKDTCMGTVSVSLMSPRPQSRGMVPPPGEEDDGFLAEEDITSRSLFPESWMWQVERLTEKPNELNISTKTLPVFLKDSITTWEVLAVSLSPNKGLCVADPYEITVMKDFFIDLRLPYSVVRNEQVEIRAVLYNYRTHDITVRVELMHNPALCSASTSKARYQQILKLKAQSSWAVPFVIVPLQLGLHDVEVKAAVRGSFVSDGVKKKLKVVVSGHRCPMASAPLWCPQHLHPLGLHEASTHVVPPPSPEMSPVWYPGDIPVSTPILVLVLKDERSSPPRMLKHGNPVAILVEKAVDGTKLKHLITTPSGCGEQNMISMTPTIIATHYLDITGQWESFGVDRRTEAIELIRKGYTQQLAFRKPDSSFAAFKDRPSSTWLTAYVAKVFAMAIKLVNIEPEVVCGAIKWLILEKQKPDGIFQEDAPVIHKEMVGGYQGAEPEVSLTAFVLVALQEARQICKDRINNLDGSITKAAEYLARKYQSLKRPYTVALTSYALALAGKLNSEQVLMKFSKGSRSWEERNARTYNIEGTSYALLALLQMEKAELTRPVAHWLAQQNYFGGGYGSTQVGYEPPWHPWVLPTAWRGSGV